MLVMLFTFYLHPPPVKAKDAVCNPVVMSVLLSVMSVTRMRGQRAYRLHRLVAVAVGIECMSEDTLPGLACATQQSPQTRPLYLATTSHPKQPPGLARSSERTPVE